MAQQQSNQVTCHSVRWFIPEHMGQDEALRKFRDWLTFIVAVSAVYQIEITSTDRKHIQAFVKTKDKIRSRTLAAGSNMHLFGVEISPCSAAGRAALEAYCMKTDSRVAGPWRFPLTQAYAGGDLYRDPYPWQKQLEEHLLTPPDDRSIWWITDSEGNSGKSKFVKKMCFYHDAVYLSHARTENILALASQKISRIYLVDLSRTKPHDIAGDDLYAAIEQIKNGMIINTKYKVSTMFFDPPHVIVFSNTPPKTSALSRDRWKLFVLTDKRCLLTDTCWNVALVTKPRKLIE